MNCKVESFGEDYKLITISSDEVELKLTNLGATIVAFYYKGHNVVKGLTSGPAYKACDKYFGATVGRVAGRIAAGTYELQGKTYSLAKNNNGNALHGGVEGFTYKVFDVELKENGVTFTYESSDGEEGYNGTVTLQVTYTVVGNKVRIDYEAESDKDTLCNITNHSYFNLNGSQSVLDEYLLIHADTFLKIDEAGLPYGEKQSVEGAFDFRNFKRIGQDIETNDEELRKGAGYDHYFIFTQDKEQIVLKGDSLQLTLSTSYPGANIYSANYLDGSEGHERRSAICLEAQYYPNDIHINEGKQTILKKNDVYKNYIEYVIEEE